MNIKHLQFNTFLSKDIEQTINYILKNEIDIACLQEIKFDNDICILENICVKNNLYVCFAKANSYIDIGLCEGVAIISKYKIIDWCRHYLNSKIHQPNILKSINEFGDSRYYPTPKTHKFSRNIAFHDTATVILTANIDIKGEIVRIITTHYTVTDNCTEVYDMVNTSYKVKSIVENSFKLPTIFSGDLNIILNSCSGDILSSCMECHTDLLDNTLHHNHNAVRYNPPGYAIDHVFSNGFGNTEKSKSEEVDFSDHNAILTIFNL